MNLSEPTTICAFATLALISARYLFEFFLDRLNLKHVKQNSYSIPESFNDIMDNETYQKSVQYTLAKSRFGTITDTFSTAALCTLLFTGWLALLFGWISEQSGSTVWGQATALWAVMLLLSFISLPFSWWSQFRIEECFGFNTTSQYTWWADQAKGIAISFVLGVPLLALILWLAQVSGDYWWLLAWAALVIFQLAMSVLAPVFILPLFNKFKPLSDGPLKERLNNLAKRTGFVNAGIQVMDGSRRSKHSNAFFTGLGKGRKIALFDTLMDQLSDEQLEAVLAHEIGHYKLRHIPKQITWSFITTLIGFWGLNLLSSQTWFVSSFSFEPEAGMAPVFLLFALLAGTVTFWVSPLSSFWSRKFEYEADAFASSAIGGSHPMISALHKIHRENLSNLTPHPWYSSFHYDHPTLIERESALKGLT